ncbi:hypothetical protein LXL04_012571 [Taraxacum kok-saghyz]
MPHACQLFDKMLKTVLFPYDLTFIKLKVCKKGDVQRSENLSHEVSKLAFKHLQIHMSRSVNEPSRARIPPSSARARLSCCRLELELGSFKVWYPSSSSAREKCKKLELGSARLVYLSSLNEPRLGSSSFMLFELD